MKKYILVFLSVCLATKGFCQQQNFSITPVSFEIQGSGYDGFSATFNMSRRGIMRQFWNYCNAFGSVTNERTHFELTIPEENSAEATKDLILAARAEERTPGQTTFDLAIELEQLPEDSQKEYIAQTKRLLVDFSVEVFREGWRNQLSQLETKASALSAEYEKKRKAGLSGEDILSELQAIQAKADAIVLDQKKLLFHIYPTGEN